MEIRELIRPEWIMPCMKARDTSEAITQLAELLRRDGVVKASFVKAVLEREKAFPTGLPTEGIKVALPHTDAEHVNQSAIAVGTLEKAVPFRVMGSPEEVVDVRVIFLLALADAEMQAPALAQLVEIVQRESLLQRLVDLKSPEDIYRLLAAC